MVVYSYNNNNMGYSRLKSRMWAIYSGVNDAHKNISNDNECLYPE